MIKQNIKCQITFGMAHSNGVGEDFISIRIEDCAARVELVRLEISPENLSKALMSRISECEIKAYNMNSEIVGKMMEVERIEFQLPPHDYKERRELAVRIAPDIVPEGWKPDLFFDSHSSFRNDKDENGDKVVIAKTLMRRWVEPKFCPHGQVITSLCFDCEDEL